MNLLPISKRSPVYMYSDEAGMCATITTDWLHLMVATIVVRELTLSRLRCLQARDNVSLEFLICMCA